MNTVLCDGGLANRLNALVFALILQRKFGHAWQVAWPINNWCGAPLQSLFDAPLPVVDTSLLQMREHGTQRMLMQENQLNFPPERFVLNSTLTSFEAYAPHLNAADGVVYFNNLIPTWVAANDVHEALRSLKLNDDVAARAWAFCSEHGIDAGTLGIHIRKTDFGDKVNDAAIFEQLKASGRRAFVCSDAAEVNDRFDTLAHCAVFKKTAFPEKVQKDAAWLHLTTDQDGRQFPYNIERGATSVVEGLIDLLILSRTELLPTSGSTFLSMARLLKASSVFQQALPASISSPPTQVKAMNETAVDTTNDTSNDTQSAAPRPVTHAELFSLLNLIRPWQMASDVKVRLGSEGDGGYVMPSSSKKSNTLLSIGIGNEVSFDDQLAALGARVLQFDHTIEASPSTHPSIQFHKRGWGSDVGPFLSLRSMMQMIDWTGAQHPILKFDTEGAEWDCLFDSSTEDLARFEVLTGEFHDFQNLVNRDYFDKAYAVFSKLELTHRVVHMHANNAGGMVMLGGIPFPRLLELTYLRKDAALFSGHSAEPIPGPLDRPNVRQLPEIYLRAF
jgi:hypothetical protein